MQLRRELKGIVRPKLRFCPFSTQASDVIRWRLTSSGLSQVGSFKSGSHFKNVVPVPMIGDNFADYWLRSLQDNWMIQIDQDGDVFIISVQASSMCLCCISLGGGLSQAWI